MTNKLNKDALKRRIGHYAALLFKYTIIITLGFVIITPLLKQLKTALTAPTSLGQQNAIWLPPSISGEAFGVATILLTYWKSLAYTLLNTAAIMLLQVGSAALAGYSFARLKFKGSGLAFGLVLLTIIVPIQSIMLSQYIEFRNFDIFGIITLFTGKPLNLISSPATIYVLSATGMGLKSGLFIYIFRQFFRGLPKEIEEASFVDGAGFIRTFFSIVLPSAKAGLVTVSVLSFVWNYGDTYYTSLLNPSKYHLALNLTKIYSSVEQSLKAADNLHLIPMNYTFWVTNPLYQYSIACATALLSILPLLLLYLFAQKQFVQGVERSGLVG